MSDFDNRQESGQEKPQLYALTRKAGGYSVDRRDFLKAAGAAASVVAAGAMSGCAADAGAGANHGSAKGNRLLLDPTASSPAPRA